jgi:hypothetical protein
LGEYLTQQDEPILNITFMEVEKIIGKRLCASAYKYKSYWYPSYDRPLSNTIYNAGYDVETVDLENKTVTLKKPEEAA